MTQRSCLLSIGLVPVVHAVAEFRYEDDIIGMAVGATMAFVFLVLFVTLIFLGMVWQRWYRQIQLKKGRVKISRKEFEREKEMKRMKKQKAKEEEESQSQAKANTATYIIQNGNVARQAHASRVNSGMEVQERTLNVADDDDDAVADIENYKIFDQQDQLVTSRGFAVLDDVPIDNAISNDDAVIQFN